jgi:hypothetical protein
MLEHFMEKYSHCISIASPSLGTSHWIYCHHFMGNDRRYRKIIQIHLAHNN